MSYFTALQSRWLILSALLLGLGCGHAEYEQRLERSRQFYSYLETLDQNLSKTPWKRADREISMRVPLPFGVPLPAPPPPTKDEAGNLVYEQDRRHPLEIGIELDGILDGWLWRSGDAQSQMRLYVVTNQDRFLANGGRPPDAFLVDLEATLASAFQVSIPEGETVNPTANSRYRLTTPTGNSTAATYTPRKTFTAIEFVPEGPVGGQQMQAALYEFENGQVQGAVLCLCPELTRQVRDRMAMALQTLQIPSRAPSATGGGTGRSSGGQAAPSF